MIYSANSFFKFCPRCGQRYHVRQSPGLLVCMSCHFQFYQNSKPTVSAFIEDEKGRILLVVRGINPQKGGLDAPGGFLKEGEDPVHGMYREVMEELGVKVARPRLLGMYLDSYYYYYHLRVLNIVYLVEISSGKLRAMDDVRDYLWFSPKQIPWRKLAFRWMKPALKDWIKYRK